MVFWQYVVPQQWITRFCGRLAVCTIPWVKNTLIKAFIRYYGVNMKEADPEDPKLYPHFNAFFTRSLKSSVRVMDSTSGGWVSPVDGTVSQLGMIEKGQLIQAKGHRYTVRALLAQDTLASQFETGQFITLYLAPRDYHRVHMPCAGTMRSEIFIPGRLFSVNAATESAVPGLFARNARCVVHFETDIGPLVMVLVGAMVVGSIATVWSNPCSSSTHETLHGVSPHLEKGDEMGRFLLGGSTVIVLWKGHQLHWNVQTGSYLTMGKECYHDLNLHE